MFPHNHSFKLLLIQQSVFVKTTISTVGDDVKL